ncbi:conjugal transfer protein TraB [Pseudothauera nasutitermitis]|uniref:Conjugal transfer protein TraB n=1 Tax=Pseudothauera nasutitermitis TaxID=2565930 RepID=A0A4S4AYA1_9RHOO|nr:TrbI/VirB10 family protein [Pseudothauera nasutitermitis]THF64940.1 conjugal transfer protein TraB [Pseudothauera nasutitermitis]
MSLSRSPHERPAGALGSLLERLSPRQRQYLLLAAIMAGGIGLLWLIFAFTGEPGRPVGTDTAARPSGVTNIGVMPPGGQVNPLDQWVGTAGRKLAQYEAEREEQNRLNNERTAFEQRTLQRFAELEQKLTAAGQAAAPPTPPPPPVPQPPSPTTMPPAESLPPAPSGAPSAALPPDALVAPPPPPAISRVTLAPRANLPVPAGAPGSAASTAPGTLPGDSTGEARTLSTYLPVSFTRGTLLGGLDAPTGGQSQSNPHPVLIRLSDNSVLPNRMRGEYRECFVLAAGYGDISSERAYLRTENLSCVRPDGHTLEVRIQGSIYGEDGKVGMRGRLVTKQGQMLANALLAGVVSGIGQGLATSSTDYSTSALGTVASTSGSDAYRAGLGTGVGRALDRLAQYYIRLAENTFPVIEIDAGREIDVVITKGVRIDTPMPGARDGRADLSPANRYLEAADDPDY